MNFVEMRSKMIAHFEAMVKDADAMFKVAVDKDEFWNLYLDSFPEGTNKIFRERREHDCSCCRHFIRDIGNAVVITDNNKLETIWDFRTDDNEYQPVLDALSAYIKERAITDVYVSKLKKIGTKMNYEDMGNGKIKEWEHFYLELPDKFVDKSSKSIPEIMGARRDTRNVFKRSLDEITQESIEVVLELISQNSLYRGEEWKGVLETFLGFKKMYMEIPDDEKENWVWATSIRVGDVIGRIRNHSIGTLLTNISENMELDEAVKKYEQIVAPANYKRPKEIFTKKMLEEAQKTITELGYLNALGRRFATLDDVTANNILFVNRDSAKKVEGAMSIFAEMAKDVAVNPKKFSKVEEVSIEKFINDILPTAKELEVLFENKHSGNLVSLIAPIDGDAPTMQKWDNPFSWAYTGNMTDSDLKTQVARLGGRVDGALRFSHTWNYDKANPNQSLMDLHVFMPDCGYDQKKYDGKQEIHDRYPEGRRVGWNRRKDLRSGASQDVDFTMIPGDRVPVENIVFPDITKMPDGEYIFKIHNWSLRPPTKSGFKAEIEFDGNLYEFEHKEPLKHKEWITLAVVTLKNGEFTIDVKHPTTASTKELWGLKTNQFVPVSTVMFSPNYWDEQTGIGNKHYFFMLKDCINPENPNGMYNEYLKEELMKHKRVFAALGSKCKVADAEEQLSGVGFSSTQRAELIVKVKGATERVLKIKF